MTDSSDDSYVRATSPADYGVDNSVDIGGGTAISFIQDGAHNRVGLHLWHNCKFDFSAGTVAFNNEAGRTLWPKGPYWDVVVAEPLTIVPSVSCLTCGHHGFITKGRWVAA